MLFSGAASVDRTRLRENIAIPATTAASASNAAAVAAQRRRVRRFCTVSNLRGSFALPRRFRTRVKCQRHPVAGWNPSQTARSFGSLKFLGRANNPVQFLNPRVLVANRKLRVTNDVDEQDMGDFELDLVLDLNGHLGGRPKIT